MNQRNVEALNGLIKEYCDRNFQTESRDVSAQRLSDFLAARGVLVPSALTDSEVDALAETVFGVEDHDRARVGLERIAKGEP